MKRLISFLLFLLPIYGELFLPLPGKCAEDQKGIKPTPTMQETLPARLATPISGAVQPGTKHEEAEETAVIYMSPGARIAFLFFILFFVALYFLIRRRPTTRQLKKKNKRKF